MSLTPPEPFVKAFAELAAGLVSGLTVGTNLFAGHVPELSADLCTAALHAGSESDQYLPKYRVERVQVTTRGQTYFTAQAEAWRIYEGLVGRRGYSSMGWDIGSIEGGEPVASGRDPLGRFLFTAHLTVRAKLTEGYDNGGS